MVYEVASMPVIDLSAVPCKHAVFRLCNELLLFLIDILYGLGGVLATLYL